MFLAKKCDCLELAAKVSLNIVFYHTKIENNQAQYPTKIKI